MLNDPAPYGVCRHPCCARALPAPLRPNRLERFDYCWEHFPMYFPTHPCHKCGETKILNDYALCEKCADYDFAKRTYEYQLGYLV